MAVVIVNDYINLADHSVRMEAVGDEVYHRGGRLASNLVRGEIVPNQSTHAVTGLSSRE